MNHNDRPTGNKIVIEIEGFCNNPDLECDLDYWKYNVVSYYPARNDNPIFEAGGILHEKYPDSAPYAWSYLTRRLLEAFAKGGFV